MTRVVRSLALGLHRWLSVLLLPPAFRREFGEELAATVRARLASKRGPFAVIGAGAKEILDLVGAAAGEWRDRARSSRKRSGNMTGMWKDVGVAARNLVKRPILSLGVILTVGLGIGATTTVFGVVDGVVLRPLPYANASRLAQIGTILPTDRTVDPQTGLQPLAPMTTTDFQGFVERTRSFDQVAATSPSRMVVLDETGLQTFIPTANVTEGFFRLLGVSPALGRTFLSDEFIFPGDVDGLQRSVAVLSYGYWQRRYGGDPEVLGRPLEPPGAGDEAAGSTIVGILPRGFQAPEALYAGGEVPEIYQPLRMPAAGGPQFAIGTNQRVVGTLAPGVTLDQARTEAAAIADELVADGLTSSLTPGGEERSLGVNDLHTATIGRTGRSLWVFLAAAGLLLLLAAMNAASLLLARALDRQAELGVRTAVGATRRRLVRHLLAESGMLTALGGALGIVLAYAGVGAFLRFAPSSMPRLDSVRVDGRVLGVALLVTAATALLAGLLPALRLTASNPWERMRRGGRSVSESTQGLRNVLVGGQLGLAVVLLAGAGLLFSSFVHIRTAEPGFDPDGLIGMRGVGTGYIRITNIDDFWQRWDPVLEALRDVPELDGVAGASGLPFQAPGWSPRVLLEDDDRDVVREGIAGYVVTPGYFETMGADVLEGRGFVPADGPNVEQVVVVNEAFVRTQMGGGQAVDRVIRRVPEGPLTSGGSQVLTLRGPDGSLPSNDPIPMRIVGVVENVVQSDVEEGPRPAIYIPYTQGDIAQLGALWPVVHTNAPMATVGPEIRRAMGTIGWLPQDLSTLADRMAVTRATPRFQTLLIGAFGLVALLLAALGLYGSLSQSVRRRQREMGIRMAMGADAPSLVRMVVAQGMRLVGVGLAVGLIATLLSSSVLRSFLYGIQPYDPVTLLGVGGVLVLVSAFACLAPARRATSVNPTVLNAE